MFCTLYTPFTAKKNHNQRVYSFFFIQFDMMQWWWLTIPPSLFLFSFSFILQHCKVRRRIEWTNLVELVLHVGERKRTNMPTYANREVKKNTSLHRRNSSFVSEQETKKKKSYRIERYPHTFQWDVWDDDDWNKHYTCYRKKFKAAKRIAMKVLYKLCLFSCWFHSTKIRWKRNTCFASIYFK